MRARLPNALSVSRIALAIAVLILSGRVTIATYTATVCLIVIAMITDVLDGRLARRWHVTSELGYVLDAMGDRAIHLALMLVFLVRYGFHPVLIWLLIFRDIGIYAVRVLSKDWLKKSLQLRWISLFHAVCLRTWLGLFVLRDGLRVFTRKDALHSTAFDAIQLALLCTTIVVAYYGLYRSFSWLIDREHDTLQT